MHRSIVKRSLAFATALLLCLGPCLEAEARCRIFGRRHARRCCSAAVRPAPVPSATVHPAPFAPPPSGLYCPLFKTTFMVGSYYYFYVGPSPGCTYTEPGYFPATTHACCLSSTQTCPNGHSCWGVYAYDRPYSMADDGHDNDFNEDFQEALGGPEYLLEIEVQGKRIIRFDTVRDAKGGQPAYLAFEVDMPGAEKPMGKPDIVKWRDYKKGFKITLTKNGPTYFLVLKKDKP